MVLASIAGAQADYYVDAATGLDNGNNGMSFAAPFATVQKALTVVPVNGEIWVAVGTYPVAAPGSPRTATYSIPFGLRLLGGFRTTQTHPDQRIASDFDRTILTGDIDGNTATSGIISDDAYHVVSSITANWIIDGFKIVYGNASGTSPGQDKGGGIYIGGSGSTFNITLKNVTVENCRAVSQGGGIYARRVQNSYWSNVVLRDNVALAPFSTTSGEGGGLFITDTFPNFDLFNFVFDGNRSARGGGLFLEVAVNSTRFQNCVWIDNGATAGGAVFLRALNPLWPTPAGPTFSHCTLAYNTATTPVGQLPKGGSAFFRKSHTGNLSISSCILYHNSYTQLLSGGNSTTTPGNFGGNNSLTLVEYSNVEILLPPPMPAWFGVGSISVPPMFINGPARILTLQAASPCIDAGDDNALLDDTANLDGDTDLGEPTPLDANLAPREVDNPVTDTGLDGAGTNANGKIADMGAFEVQ